MANEIVGLRDVHEILHSKRSNRPYVAFVQHGTSDEGYSYTVICPWCAKDLGRIEEEVKDFLVEEIGITELAKKLRAFVVLHQLACPSSQFRLAVRKATKPLGTQQKERIT